MSSSNRPPVDQAAMLCIPEAHFKEIVDYYHITPVHYYDYGKVCLHQAVLNEYSCATTCRAEIDEQLDNGIFVLGLIILLLVVGLALAQIRREQFRGGE